MAEGMGVSGTNTFAPAGKKIIFSWELNWMAVVFNIKAAPCKWGATLQERRIL